MSPDGTLQNCATQCSHSDCPCTLLPLPTSTIILSANSGLSVLTLPSIIRTPQNPGLNHSGSWTKPLFTVLHTFSSKSVQLRVEEGYSRLSSYCVVLLAELQNFVLMGLVGLTWIPAGCKEGSYYLTWPALLVQELHNVMNCSIHLLNIYFLSTYHVPVGLWVTGTNKTDLPLWIIDWRRCQIQKEFPLEMNATTYRTQGSKRERNIRLNFVRCQGRHPWKSDIEVRPDRRVGLACLRKEPKSRMLRMASAPSLPVCPHSLLCNNFSNFNYFWLISLVNIWKNIYRFCLLDNHMNPEEKNWMHISILPKQDRDWGMGTVVSAGRTGTQLVWESKHLLAKQKLNGNKTMPSARVLTLLWGLNEKNNWETLIIEPCM